MKPINLLLIALIGALACQNPSGETDISQANKEMVARAFKIVGAGDYDQMDQVIAENYVRHCQATPEISVNSRSEFKEFIRQDRETFPDQKMEVKYLVAEGNMVAFYATYTGTQKGPMGPFPALNKKMYLDFAGAHRVENGKIAETWITWDNLAALSQLGHSPPAPTEDKEAGE